jgi:hypothetical protein
MKSTPRRLRRIRTLSLSAGMVLGMIATTVAPQLTHAASAKTSKKAQALPEATPEQQQAAQRVHVGKYQCELGKSIAVQAAAAHNGYFDLKSGKQSWVMKPVTTETGATRLEDVKGQTVLIQILTKSMLMDQKAGRRLIDGCVHPTQQVAADELARQPARASVFDAPAK